MLSPHPSDRSRKHLMSIFVSLPADALPSDLGDPAAGGTDALVLSTAGGIEPVCTFLRSWPHPARNIPLHVSVSPFSSGRTEDELRALMPLHPDAIHLRACETSADVQKLDVVMSVHEAECGWQGPPVPIFTEFGATASGILAPGSYKNRSHRLAGLVWNAEALLEHIGVSAAPDGAAADLARLGRCMALLKAREAEVSAFLAVAAARDRKTSLRRAKADGFFGIIAAAPVPLET